MWNFFDKMFNALEAVTVAVLVGGFVYMLIWGFINIVH